MDVAGRGAGLDAAGTCDAIVMLLGDMPGVTAEIIDRVLATWRGNPTWAAVTDYRGQLGSGRSSIVNR